MLIYPDSTLRITPYESFALEPSIRGIGSLTFSPKYGESIEVEVKDGTVYIPGFSCPNIVNVEWLKDDVSLYESTLEIVARHYFTIEQFRAQNPLQDCFDNEEEYPDELIFTARQAATDIFEGAARRSFVKRCGCMKDWGRDALITVPDGDVSKVVSDGYKQVSSNQLEAKRCGEYPRFIEYFYGTDSMPVEVSHAVLQLTQYMVRPSNRPIGATGESSDAGYIHFTTAGRDGATSIPEVNAAIQQFGRGVQCVW